MSKLDSMSVLIAVIFATAGCESLTDPATRLAYDIEAGVDQLGGEDGATHSIRHDTPSKSGECSGPYKLQLDRVGAMIVWCYDAAGNTVSSHSTTYHSRFVDTPQTSLIGKEAGEALTIDLERRGNRAVIIDVQ